ncbi:MAG: hypothetical protein SPE18_03180 [Candidatus Limivicinus sp.]|nr:hypothetical protein [Candidatus Limivicinus sp.]
MVLRDIVRRMLCMSDAAWYIFIRSIQLSCVMLFCSFLLLLSCDGSLMQRAQYMTAMALYEGPQGMLLGGLILSVFAEELQSRRR